MSITAVGDAVGGGTPRRGRGRGRKPSELRVVGARAYDDGRGFGAWRGDDHVESDEWDLSHPGVVVRGGGQTVRPIHRIQPVRVALRRVRFDGVGTGTLTRSAEGSVARPRGLAASYAPNGSTKSRSVPSEG